MPDLSQKPIDTWGPEDVRTAASSGLPPTYEVARRMLEDHDYFQDGKLWVGQRAEAGLSSEQVRRIRPLYIPDPLLEEIRENRTNGLLQREATVAFDAVKPVQLADGQSPEIDPRVATVVRAIARWWDKKKFWEKVRIAFGRTSYSRRAALRFYVPTENLIDVTDDGQTQSRKALQTLGTLDEALDRIEVEAPLPDLAGRFTLASQREVGFIITGGDDATRTSELWSVDPVTKRTKVRVLNRSFGNRMAGAGNLTVEYDLGGRLPVVELTTAELVTDPIIKQQSLLNFASTVLNRVLETAGFPERYILNAEPPGIWLSYPPEGEEPLAKYEQDGTTYYKHRRPWVFGFSTVAEVIGAKLPQLDAQGREVETIATPSVQRFDPVDPSYVKTAKELIRNAIYKNCRQGHYATDSTAEASGVAYEQARAQFEADLVTLKGLLESMVRDAIEVALAYAGIMHAETKTFLDAFRCVVTLHVTSGPITPAQQQEVRANRDAGLLSDETAMGRIGIEDMGAERALIDAQPASRLALLKQQFELLDQAMQINGVDVAGAGKIIGLSDEVIGILTAGQVVPPESVPAAPTLAA